MFAGSLLYFGLSVESDLHRWDFLPKHQTAADCLVPGDLHYQLSQDGFVHAGSEAASERLLYPTAQDIEHKPMEAMFEREMIPSAVKS